MKNLDISFNNVQNVEAHQAEYNILSGLYNKKSFEEAGSE